MKLSSDIFKTQKLTGLREPTKSGAINIAISHRVGIDDGDGVACQAVWRGSKIASIGLLGDHVRSEQKKVPMARPNIGKDPETGIVLAAHADSARNVKKKIISEIRKPINELWHRN